MDSITISSYVNVRLCSQCHGDTEYHCRTCHQNLCPPCKRKHTISLDTKEHHVTVYREKFKSLYKTEICAKHPDQVYKKYCDTCELPFCRRCTEHGKHKQQTIKTTYEIKRKENRDILINIRSESLYNARSVSKIIVNKKFEIIQNERISSQAETMKMKSQKMKIVLETIVREKSYLKQLHRCKKQMIRLKTHIARLQSIENIYEHSATRPVKFLRIIKEKSFSKVQCIPHLKKHCLLSMSQEINIWNLTKVLSETQITDSGKPRRAGSEGLLTLMPSNVLQRTISVTGIKNCYHISCLTSNLLCVSDGFTLTLTNTSTGKTQHLTHSIAPSLSGVHTVNSACELIYISKKYKIKKLCNKRKKVTTLIKSTGNMIIPSCVYCSPFSENLLVGMMGFDKIEFERTGKVMRYDGTLILIQTIKDENVPSRWYRSPSFITENNNGDVVVSDIFRIFPTFGELIVTSREGIHRFTYTGPSPSGRGLFLPQGICTDVLSNILVYDGITHTVQIIDKDGRFLSYILARNSIGGSLSYDMSTHQLLVGSRNSNIVDVYRYIDRHTSFTG